MNNSHLCNRLTAPRARWTTLCVAVAVSALPTFGSTTARAQDSAAREGASPNIAVLQESTWYERDQAEKRSIRRTRIGTAFGVILGVGGLGAMTGAAVAARFCLSFDNTSCSGRGHTAGSRSAMSLGAAALVGGIVWTAVSSTHRRTFRHRRKHRTHLEGPSTRRWQDVPAPTQPPATLRF